MVFFITVLRALAACLITNSHYSGIYPLSILGSGGLLGDRFPFPLNWFLVTAAILAEAFVLRKGWQLIQLGFKKLFSHKKATT